VCGKEIYHRTLAVFFALCILFIDTEKLTLLFESILKMYFIIFLYAILWGASQVVPWFHMRSYGITLSFKNYWFSLFIRKNIFAYWHNRRIFEALVTIKNNNLDLTLKELEEMYNANVDLENYINAVILAKNKNIIASKDVLKTLAYSSRHRKIIPIINSKNQGEEIVVEDAYKS
jgi:uncharacterized protein YqfA (UPF0365 family)